MDRRCTASSKEFPHRSRNQREDWRECGPISCDLGTAPRGHILGKLKKKQQMKEVETITKPNLYRAWYQNVEQLNSTLTEADFQNYYKFANHKRAARIWEEFGPNIYLDGADSYLECAWFESRTWHRVYWLPSTTASSHIPSNSLLTSNPIIGRHFACAAENVGKWKQILWYVRRIL